MYSICIQKGKMAGQYRSDCSQWLYSLYCLNLLMMVLTAALLNGWLIGRPTMINTRTYVRATSCHPRSLSAMVCAKEVLCLLATYRIEIVRSNVGGIIDGQIINLLADDFVVAPSCRAPQRLLFKIYNHVKTMDMT